MNDTWRSPHIPCCAEAKAMTTPPATQTLSLLVAIVVTASVLAPTPVLSGSRDAAMADAMRARLREHLRFVEGPRAMLDLDLAERDFAAERVEVRAAQREGAQQEHELTTARWRQGPIRRR
jgi:hypothetical protein